MASSPLFSKRTNHTSSENINHKGHKGQIAKIAKIAKIENPLKHGGMEEAGEIKLGNPS
jgi:hypothetical protein